MRRFAVTAVLAVVLSACGGGGGSSPAAGTNPSPSATAAGVNHAAGTARATVDVDGTPQEFTGGTCSQRVTSPYAVFQFTSSANPLQAPYLEVFVSTAEAIHDGDYSGGLTTVDVKVGTEDYLLQPVTVTLRNGQTSGEFSGTSYGSNPLPVSGSFDC